MTKQKPKGERVIRLRYKNEQMSQRGRSHVESITIHRLVLLLGADIGKLRTKFSERTFSSGTSNSISNKCSSNRILNKAGLCRTSNIMVHTLSVNLHLLNSTLTHVLVLSHPHQPTGILDRTHHLQPKAQINMHPLQRKRMGPHLPLLLHIISPLSMRLDLRLLVKQFYLYHRPHTRSFPQLTLSHRHHLHHKPSQMPH
jgi:hypothetical protein